MIITKTPFRMSFFGGGTDMASFYEEHGGAVLSTTFDYCEPHTCDFNHKLGKQNSQRI